MKPKTYNLMNVLLTLSGFLFSDYLSSVKFFTSNCAYQEPCPFFLGYPACYFGFGLFSTLFIASVLAAVGKIPARAARYALRTVSFAGVVFAGYFVSQEVTRFAASGFQSGALALPTCAYGLVFFLIIFAASFYKPGTHEVRIAPSTNVADAYRGAH